MTRRMTVCAAIAMALSGLGVTSQNPAFTTKIEAVRVDALVTDHNQPVRGLGPPDFEILDNGVPQQVDLVSSEQMPVNLILTLDMSDSVAGERLDNLRDAGKAAIAPLGAADQTALVTFSDAVSLGAPLTHDAAAVRGALDEAVGAGQTSLVDGVFAAMMVGESDVGRALLIVFSDGLDTSSFLTADAVLDSARRSDIVAYAVAVQSRTKLDFLRALTSLTGGRLMELEKTSDLASAFRVIVDEFRQRYLVSYRPRGVAKEGWHRLEVRVKRRGVTVKARPGYFAGG
jgi:Ca-activated chloride channel family protein